MFFIVSLQIVPEFHFILFRIKVFASFRFVFASFHFRFASDAKTSEKNTFFSLRSENNFASVLLRSENDGSFCFFFILFSLRLIFVSLWISTFNIDENKQKNTFFLIEANKISLPFRFISLRSENDGAP